MLYNSISKSKPLAQPLFTIHDSLTTLGGSLKAEGFGDGNLPLYIAPSPVLGGISFAFPLFYVIFSLPPCLEFCPSSNVIIRDLF